MPRQRRKPKLWFVLELMHDERADPSMYFSTEGLVRSSQALSRTNENENFRFRFFGFETGCELVRVFLKLVFKLVLNLGGGLELLVIMKVQIGKSRVNGSKLYEECEPS